MRYNPLIFNGLDFSGSGGGGSSSFKDPVTTETALPLVGNSDGDVIVTLDTDYLWVWNNSTSRWINTGIKSNSFGSTPSAAGYSLDYVNVGSNRRELRLTLQPADATNPGSLSTTAQTIGGNKTFNGSIFAEGGVVDRATTGTLTIGGTNADVINLGHSSATVNIIGDVNIENVTNLDVDSKLITVNHGGGVGSAANTGIQFEENGSITGYMETSGDRNSIVLKAPNTAGIATITPGASGLTIDGTEVKGPATATDNAVPRYDGTSGKLIQDSLVTIDDAGNITATGINISATPNTVAGFDGSGNLETIPNWNIDTTWGGPSISIPVTPASNPNQTDTIYGLNTAITPSVDLTQYSFNALVNQVQAIGPKNFDVVTAFNNSLEYDNAGEAGQLNLQIGNLTLGDGATASISDSANWLSGSLTIRDQHSSTNAQLINLNLNLNSGSTVDGVIGYNQGISVDSSPTNNVQGMNVNMSNSAAMPNGYNGISQNVQVNADVQFITSVSTGLNVNSGTISGGIQGYTDGANVQSGAVINGYNSYNAYPQLHAGATINGYGVLNANPTIDSDLSTFQYNGITINGQLSNNLSGVQIFSTGASLNSGTTIANNFYAFNDVTNAQSGSSMNSYYAINSTPNFHTGSTISNFQGINIGPTIDISTTNVSLMQLSPNGSGTADNLTGLNINLSGLDSTNRKVALNINDGIINANTQVTTQSSLGVDSINQIIPQLAILNGSPITGTTVFAMNAATLLAAQDDFAAGPLGLSLIATADVGQIAIDAGKTVDSVAMVVAGAQVSGDGTLGSLIAFDALGALVGTGTPTLTNFYGFKDGGLLSALATNAWGINIGDANAENFLKKSLAINTTSEKVSASNIGLEIKTKDVLVDGGTVTINALSDGVVISTSGLLSTTPSPFNPGDINQTSFTALDNQPTPQDITGFLFSNASVRSFDAIVSIVRDTTYAQYEIHGIQKASSWEMSQDLVGDITGIDFTITNAGQVQYTSTNTGFDADLRFTADVTNV